MKSLAQLPDCGRNFLGDGNSTENPSTVAGHDINRKSLPQSVAVSHSNSQSDLAGCANKSRLFVRQLQVAAKIGVHSWEKLDLQPVVIDLEMSLPSELPCHTDKLVDAINYAEVVSMLKYLATARHYELVESMAETMAHSIQHKFIIPWLKLRLSKLAPFPGAEVGIEIERSLNDLSIIADCL